MSTEETNQFVINSRTIDNDHKKLVEEKKELLELRNTFNKEIKTLEKELKSIMAIKGLAKEQMEKKKEIVRRLSQDTRALRESRDALEKNLDNVKLSLNKEKEDTNPALQHILSMTIKERLKEGNKMINDYKRQYKPSYFSRLYKYFTGKGQTGIRSRRIVPHNNTQRLTSKNGGITSMPRPKGVLFLNGRRASMPSSMSTSKVVRPPSSHNSKRSRRPLRGSYTTIPPQLLKKGLTISNIGRRIRASNNIAPNFHQKLSRTLSAPKHLETKKFTIKSRSNNPIIYGPRPLNNSFLFEMD